MVFEVKFPILGFEKLKELKLIKIDDLFMKLENVDNPNPSFTLINPYMLREYEFDIPIYIKSLLDIKNDTKFLVFNIIIIANPIDKSSVNFIAPLIFNTENNLMAQVVLDGAKYPYYGISEPISMYIVDKKDKE